MFEFGFKALGTDIAIKIADIEADDALAREMKLFYSRYDKIFSRFREDSELSSLNNNVGQFNQASPEILEVAQKCLDYYQGAQGYFDPRIIDTLEGVGYRKDFKTTDFQESEYGFAGDKFERELSKDLKIEAQKLFFRRRMDFSGIAKGYISDQAAIYLKNKGYANILVDSGGDIRILGQEAFGENWKVSVEGLPDEGTLVELTKEYQGIATSGITRRKWQSKNKNFHHLINPKEPENFSFELKSVTVVARSTTEADVWAKTLFLVGKSAGQEFCEKNHIKSIFLYYNGNAWISKNMKNSLIIG